MDKVKSTPNNTIRSKPWSQVDTSSWPWTALDEFRPGRGVKLTTDDAKQASTRLWSQVDEANRLRPMVSKFRTGRGVESIMSRWLPTSLQAKSAWELIFPIMIQAVGIGIGNLKTYSYRFGKKYGQVCACMGISPQMQEKIYGCMQLAIIQVTFDTCLRQQIIQSIWTNAWRIQVTSWIAHNINSHM